MFVSNMIGLLLVHNYIWAHNLDVESVYCSFDPENYDCIISTKSLRSSASFQSSLPVLKEIPSICIYAPAAFAWQEVTLLLMESIKLDTKYCIHCQAIFVREHECKLLIG